MAEPMQIVPLTENHRAWLTQFLTQHWGSPRIVSRGNLYQADQLPGLLAIQEGNIRGALTYHIEQDACEIVTLGSVQDNEGAGSALLTAISEVARESGCHRLWLTTTNDNMHAQRFYQKRGFTIVAVHQGAIDEARKLKPEIALTGIAGVPIHDEIEMEMRL